MKLHHLLDTPSYAFSYNGNAILITALNNYVKSIQNTCLNDMSRFTLLFF